MMRLLAGLCFLAAACQAQEATFGTTVVISSGLRGDIYYLKPGSTKLPKFKRMKSVGVIYATVLNIRPRSFTSGFPGVTERFEWFAIDYNGRIWIEKPGEYRFHLVSDDGSRLYIDDHEIIDNDGIHPAVARQGAVDLSGGIHRIRLAYFQGPRFEVALILSVARPGESFRIFNMDEFIPPPNPDDWKYGKPENPARPPH